MRVRRFLVTSCAVALAFSTGVAAAADLSLSDPTMPYAHSGYGFVAELGAWAGWLERTGEGMNESGGTSEDEGLPLIGLNGAVAFPLGSMFVTQFDLDGELAFEDAPGSGDNYEGSLVGGAHLAYGTLAGHNLGVFGAYGATADENPGQDATLWALGIEGRAVLGGATLLGQVGYLDANADSLEGLNDAWFVRGVGRTTFNGGRTSLEGELSYADGLQDDDGTTEPLQVIGWGVEIEHACACSTPDRRISGFLRYDGLYFNEDEGGGVKTEIVDHLFRGGIRVTWGGADMGQGAPFSLPRFGHWVGGASALD